MRLTQYLVEKISKTEINEILKDNNVMIGSEFEFILDGLEDNLGDEYEEEYGKSIDDMTGIHLTNVLDMWKEEVSYILKRNKFPFRYKVTTNAKETSKTIWIVVPDTSAGMYSVEVKSPPQPISIALKSYEKMFNWINKYGDTDFDCGFHSHISLKNVSNLKKSLNIVKLVLFVDEGFIYKYFPTRVSSIYAVSLKDKISAEGNLTPEDLKLKSLLKDFSKSHYDAINLEHLEKDRIEFRYLGGPDYHKKWNKIKPILAQYSYALKIACDENYKRKEYVQKLKRFINKLPVKGV